MSMTVEVPIPDDLIPRLVAAIDLTDLEEGKIGETAIDVAARCRDSHSSRNFRSIVDARKIRT